MAEVNFQTPTEGTYQDLSALLGLDPKANACHVVTTVSEKAIQGLTFAQFAAHGAHGVAGVTVTAKPSLPGPIYFNEGVIPDVNQKLSSRDGGVLFTNVPAGTYTLTATHPTQQFVPIVVTCAPGRIVNANPPWGLHEVVGK